MDEALIHGGVKGAFAVHISGSTFQPCFHFHKDTNSVHTHHAKHLYIQIMHPCTHSSLHPYPIGSTSKYLLHLCAVAFSYSYIGVSVHPYLHCIYAFMCSNISMHLCTGPTILNPSTSVHLRTYAQGIHASMRPCVHASLHACIQAHPCIQASMHPCTHASKIPSEPPPHTATQQQH